MKRSLPLLTTHAMFRAFLLLVLLGLGQHSLAENMIVVSKSRQELIVLQDQKVIKQYRIAYGKGGKGSKRFSGDKKTPDGIYRIIDFKDNSQFHLFMQLDYPNMNDAWHGYHNQLISAMEFKSIALANKTGELPPQDTPLGGYIGIHGLGDMNNEKLEIHNRHNWTNGCIALTNEEIMDLAKFVSIGTKVVIRE